VVLILVIPWIGAIFYFWWHRPKDGAIPRSMGDEAREHLDGV